MKRLVIPGGIILIVLIALILGSLYLLSKHSSSKSTAIAKTGCIAQQYSEGSSGVCVSDLQIMVNFVETDDLTQCPFVGAQILQSSGIYDAATASQVKVIQNWFNCYNRQEGDKSTISANGNVGESTWSELCTYAYQFPKGSGSSVSPYLKASIIAGKNAGC